MTMLPVRTDLIPTELKAYQRWVLWRADKVGDKTRKIPLHPLTLEAINPSSSEAWLSFDDAVDSIVLAGVDGLGFYLTEDLGIACIDIDDVKNKGEISLDTYTEVSPSGAGLHMWCFADAGSIHKNLGKFEIYTDKQFITVTGQRIGDVEGLVDGTDTILSKMEEVEEAAAPPISPYEYSQKLGQLLQKKYVLDLWNFGKVYSSLGGAEKSDHSRADLSLATIAVEEGWPDDLVIALLKEYRRRAKQAGWPVSAQKTEGREDYYQLTVSKARGSLTAKLDDWTCYSINDILNFPPPEWLITNAIPKSSFAMLWGNYGTGKTFIALDLAMRLVHGMPWLDHAVDSGDVLYILGEGRFAIKPRVEAWLRVNSPSSDHINQFRLHTSAIQLANRGSSNFISAYVNHRLKRPRLIVIDTLSRSMVGVEENAAEAMTEVVDNVTNIIDQTGCAVLVLHHSTKALNTSRGSSALPGAVDISIEVRPFVYKYKTQAHQHRFSHVKNAFEIHNEKNRVAKTFDPKVIKLDPVTLSPEEECVVVRNSPVLTAWLQGKGLEYLSINANQLERIWDLYKRKRTPATIGRAVGMGSNRVVAIVEEMGGRFAQTTNARARPVQGTNEPTVGGDTNQSTPS